MNRLPNPKDITRPPNPGPDNTSGLNFYFNDTSKIVGPGNNTGDKSLKYIIMQNDEFHNKNLMLEKNLNDLKQENTNLEDYNERLENDKMRLKGIAINEAEKVKTFKEIVVLYGSELKSQQQTFTKLDKYIKRYTVVLFALQLFYVAGSMSLYSFNRVDLDIPLNSLLQLLMVNLITSAVSYKLFYPMYRRLIPFSNLNVWGEKVHTDIFYDLTKKLKIIEEAEKGSVYLEQLIDN